MYVQMENGRTGDHGQNAPCHAVEASSRDGARVLTPSHKMAARCARELALLDEDATKISVPYVRLDVK